MGADSTAGKRFCRVLDGHHKTATAGRADLPLVPDARDRTERLAGIALLLDADGRNSTEQLAMIQTDGGMRDV